MASSSRRPPVRLWPGAVLALLAGPALAPQAARGEYGNPPTWPYYYDPAAK